MNFNRTQIIVLGIIAVVVIVIVLGLLGIIPGIKKQTVTDPNFPTGAVDLKIWGVGDDQSAFGETIKAYEAVYKNVKIDYTKFDDPATYENQLINALAENRGPDIFMVHSSWVFQQWGKMYPALSSIITPQIVAQLYPSVVLKDFIISGNIFALPLSMDALTLIYNKDVFNSNGIVFPPKTWDEFIADVAKIRQIDQNKKITLSATALGGANNVNNLSDILTVLAMQSGSAINNTSNSGVTFDTPFSQTVKFYTQFADPISPYYTWNESFDNSLASFAAGKTAMILDYYSSLKDIASRNAYLNYGFAALPQVSLDNASQIANRASYWGLAVSRQTSSPYISWHFINFLTTNPTYSSLYLKQSGKLPALNSLIQQGLGGDNDVFLREFLTAKTWYQADAFAIDSIWKGMIGDILSGKINQDGAIRAAEGAINKLYPLAQ
jgi:ABC-type glycerol-3-phosphate transport system substrate-binding protein